MSCTNIIVIGLDNIILGDGIFIEAESPKVIVAVNLLEAEYRAAHMIFLKSGSDIRGMEADTIIVDEISQLQCIEHKPYKLPPVDNSHRGGSRGKGGKIKYKQHRKLGL
jgi:ABC-type uncharacterized transport system permease subunit